MGNDHTIANLTLEMLADSEAELRERVASLEADNAIYRELTCAACDALHSLTVARDRERVHYQRLKDQYQALCERLLLEAGADDPDVAA
jgi:hypothetical protein